MRAAASEYNFTQLLTQILQELELGNSGTFSYYIKSDAFFHGENIFFVKDLHFNGNQFRICSDSNYQVEKLSAIIFGLKFLGVFD